MIKLPDGELRDFLPVTMKNDVDMVCLSYSIKKATERLVRYGRASMAYHFIDNAPGHILDVLAVELRSPYYSDTLPVEKKREIVKNTLRWHAQAGTPGAVEEMINVVFGGGKVVEWPDFDEPPYTPGTFDIETGAQITPETISSLLMVIDRVKNVRSHLRRILVHRRTEQAIYGGAGVRQVHHPPAVMDGYNIRCRMRQNIYGGAGVRQVHHPPAVVDGYGIKRETRLAVHGGAGVHQVFCPPAVMCGPARDGLPDV